MIWALPPLTALDSLGITHLPKSTVSDPLYSTEAFVRKDIPGRYGGKR